MKCFSMRMTFDLLDELLNAEIFCFLHNCMWQSWHSEVNVYFLELGELLSTHGSPRSCKICVYVFVLCLRICLQVQQTLAHNSGWILVHPQVSPFLLSVWCLRDQTRRLFRSSGWTVAHPWLSPFLIIGFLVLVGFVGCPCCFQLLLNPILSSNYLRKKSLEEAEVTHILSRIWFLQIPS